MKKKKKRNSSFPYRFWAIVVSVQIVLLLCFVPKMSHRNHPAYTGNLITSTITVDNSLYVSGWHQAGYLLVYSYSANETFVIKREYTNYHGSEMENAISKGDQLTIRYYPTGKLREKLFGKRYVVVDARENGTVHLSFDDYIQKTKYSPLIAVILFIVLESLLLSFPIGHVFITQRRLYFRRRNKKT